MFNKSAGAYQHLFGFINQNILKLEPQSFMTDYEPGLRKALKTVFPSAILKGCWFHYCQALRSRILKIKGFGKLLKKNQECNIWFRSFQILPLVKPNQIKEMVLKLKNDFQNLPKVCHSDLKKFIKYYEKEWMIKVRKKF